jgi:hypothetical protein
MALAIFFFSSLVANVMTLPDLFRPVRPKRCVIRVALATAVKEERGKRRGKRRERRGTKKKDEERKISNTYQKMSHPSPPHRTTIHNTPPRQSNDYIPS